MTTPPGALLDHLLIAERFLFPRPDPPRARLDAGDAWLACGLHRADPAGHTVVHFHGNGEVVADWQDGFDEAIPGMGWDLLLAEYRAYGGSTGEPRLGRMLDDVAPHHARRRCAGAGDGLRPVGRLALRAGGGDPLPGCGRAEW